MNPSSQPIKNFFSDLLMYNFQSNLKVWQIINENKHQLPSRTLFLFSHIQNAHHIWNYRIIKKEALYKVFQEHSIEPLNILNQNNHDITQQIIKENDLNTPIQYTNTKNETFTNTIQDILFHIINHSTYHRAQIATLLRQENINPPITDYIAYKRSKF